MINYIKKTFGIIILVIISFFGEEHILFGAVASTPKLTLNSEKTTNGILLTAILEDSKGNPIPDAPIYFSTMTSFGPLKLKSLPTAEDGSVSFLIPGNERRGEFVIEANFKGNENYNPVNEKTNIFFTTAKLNENSFLRLPLPFFIPFSKVMNDLIPNSSDILLSNEENRGSTFKEIQNGTSITPYPSIELFVILIIIFGAIWSIYFYVVIQILQIKKNFSH